MSGNIPTEETYPKSSLKRAKQLQVIGKGSFCCIANCNSTTYDKFGNASKIGMFSFPKDDQLKAQWSHLVSTYLRKSVSGIKNSTKVCEFHFDIKNIKVSLGRHIKTLKPGAIPTIFPDPPESGSLRRKRAREDFSVAETDLSSPGRHIKALKHVSIPTIFPDPPKSESLAKRNKEHSVTETDLSSPGRNIKTLKPGAIPTIFPDPPENESQAKRNQLEHSVTEEELSSQKIDNTICSICCQKQGEIDTLKNQCKKLLEENNFLKASSNVLKNDFYFQKQEEIDRLKKQYNELLESNNSLNKSIDMLKTDICELNDKVEDSSYSYNNISKNEILFKQSTGLELDAFNHLFELTNSERSKNTDLYSNAFSDTTNEEQKSIPQYSKTKHKREPMDAKDQLFLCLAWLKNGFTKSHVSWLFKTPKSTLSRYVIIWINLLYSTLKNLQIWPSREDIDLHMPASFKKTVPTTRVIIDCIKIFCERPSSLISQSAMYSSYKPLKYKGLVGISPSGEITFVSQLYPGSISDKEIAVKSGLLNEKLWEINDSVMADRDIFTEDDLKKHGVTLNTLTILKDRDQLTMEEVKKNQTMASVRQHIERAIHRVKKIQMLQKEVPLLFHGSINQMWTVCTLLCNFMPPLIAKDT